MFLAVRASSTYAASDYEYAQKRVRMTRHREVSIVLLGKQEHARPFKDILDPQVSQA